MGKEYKQDYEIKYKNHSEMKIDLPTRLLLCGKTGSGKTNWLMNFITLTGAFDRIYLFAKCLDEPLYKMLIGELQKVEAKYGSQMLWYSDDLADLQAVNEFDKNYNNLVIFDDMLAEKVAKQKNIADIFLRGRKQHITSVYLSQEYYRTPKAIRDQMAYIVLQGISSVKNIKMIIKEYLIDEDPDDLFRKYRKATNKENLLDGFVLIDTKSNTPEELRFRDGFYPFSS
jgi:hypothetical protein